MVAARVGSLGVGVAKGDLFALDADARVARVPVGADGAPLVADSAAEGGLSYSPPPVQIWMPDAPPAVPNAKDWEGADSDITQWIEWDFGTRLAAPSYANGHLLMNYAGAAGSNWAGVYQAVGTNQYVVAAKLSQLAAIINFAHIGLVLFEDATSLTGNVAIVFRVSLATAANSFYIATMNDYTSAGRVDHATSTNSAAANYMRWRVNGGTAWGGVSSDGTEWSDSAEAGIALGYTPQHYGVAVMSAASISLVGKLGFFRVIDGVSGQDSVTLGRLVNLGVP